MPSFGMASIARCLNDPQVTKNLNQIGKAFGLYRNFASTNEKIKSFVLRVLSAIPVLGILTGAGKIDRGIKGLDFDLRDNSIYHKAQIVRGIGEILGLGALFLIVDAAITANRELKTYLGASKGREMTLSENWSYPGLVEGLGETEAPLQSS